MLSEKQIAHLNKLHNLIKTHGLKGTRIEVIWQGMKQRCHNPNSKAFPYYGGRGISVCDRWKNSLQNFFDDMGAPPESFTIDRINNDGNYEPGNCRWASRASQQSNRRNNHFIEYDGRRQTAMEWANELGIAHQTIYGRIELGWSVEDILFKGKKINKSGLSLGIAASVAKRKKQTHCKFGHEFTPDNTTKNGKNGRGCKKCRAARQRAYMAKKKQLILQP